MNESMTELTDKQVINVCDGRFLGYVTDFKVDQCSGRLTAIILPGEGGFFNFKKCNDIVIPWEKIVKIGIDVILVDIGNSPCCDFDDCEQKKKRDKKC